VCVRDTRSGEVLLAHREHEVHRTASIGKLLLLEDVAAALDAGTLDGAELLDRRGVAPVADSGLWQHLDVDVLPLHDVAVLVASVSDNLATNVLVHRVGLPAARGPVALHDVVRDRRGPEHPPTLSTGTAAALVDLVRDLSPRVRTWLRAGTDLSMVASAFALDPLAHADADLLNKTGTDGTVRADVGVAGHLAYAVLAEWDAGQDLRHEVLHGMRLIGEQIRDRLRSC
jgi:beta-lactamase class A